MGIRLSRILIGNIKMKTNKKKSTKESVLRVTTELTDSCLSDTGLCLTFVFSWLFSH